MTWAPAIVEPTLVEGEVLARSTVTPDRGDILGAGGLAIVTERPVVRVGIDKPSLGDAKAGASARELAELVGVEPGAVRRSRSTPPVRRPSSRRSSTAVTRCRAGCSAPSTASRARGRSRAYLSLAPTREFAAPILGRVGEVTAEMIEEDPERYQVGDVAGLSGLQARYDDQLRGTPGISVAAVDAGGVERGLFRFESRPGTELQLSLDIDLQTEAERLLAAVGPASALVALRPSTGEDRGRGQRTRATTASTWRRSASSPRARRSRASARWRCCAPG